MPRISVFVLVGAFAFIAFDNHWLTENFTTLPIQIYNWTQQPSDQFRDIAASAIIVLLVILLSLNTIAILLRNRFRRVRT